MISLRPFLCYLVWVTFHQSSLDQPQYASADYKACGPLNLSGCWCSSNYSASTHAPQIGALWPLQLVLYFVTSFLSFKQSSGPKPCEENAPYPNFLLVENRVKDDCRSFSLTLQRATVCDLVPLHLKKEYCSLLREFVDCHSLFVVSMYLVFFWSTFYPTILSQTAKFRSLE